MEKRPKKRRAEFFGGKKMSPPSSIVRNRLGDWKTNLIRSNFEREREYRSRFTRIRNWRRSSKSIVITSSRYFIVSLRIDGGKGSVIYKVDDQFIRPRAVDREGIH